MARVSLCVAHKAPKYLSKPRKLSDFQFIEFDSWEFQINLYELEKNADGQTFKTHKNTQIETPTIKSKLLENLL